MNYLFIYFWLSWVFVAAHGLSLAAVSGGLLFVAICGLLIVVASLVAEQHRLWGAWASIVAAIGISSSTVCGIFLDQALNLFSPELEKEIITRSNILAWKIPWMVNPGSPWGCKESDMTEQLHFHFLPPPSPRPPALAGRISPTQPPGKSLLPSFYICRFMLLAFFLWRTLTHMNSRGFASNIWK